MTIYNDDNISVTVTVTLHPFPTPNEHDFTVARYEVVASDNFGDHDVEGSVIVGQNLYHDQAYKLLKLAGVPWREAQRLLSWSYTDALDIHRVRTVTS